MPTRPALLVGAHLVAKSRSTSPGSHHLRHAFQDHHVVADLRVHRDVGVLREITPLAARSGPWRERTALLCPSPFPRLASSETVLLAAVYAGNHRFPSPARSRQPIDSGASQRLALPNSGRSGDWCHRPHTPTAASLSPWPAGLHKKIDRRRGSLNLSRKGYKQRSEHGFGR